MQDRTVPTLVRPANTQTVQHSATSNPTISSSATEENDNEKSFAFSGQHSLLIDQNHLYTVRSRYNERIGRTADTATSATSALSPSFPSLQTAISAEVHHHVTFKHNVLLNFTISDLHKYPG